MATGTFTVSLTLLVVTLAHGPAPVTMQRNLYPFKYEGGVVTVSALVLVLLNTDVLVRLFHPPVVLSCHWLVGCVPVAVTLKLVELPKQIVLAVGWLVIAIAVSTAILTVSVDVHNVDVLFIVST